MNSTDWFIYLTPFVMLEAAYNVVWIRNLHDQLLVTATIALVLKWAASRHGIAAGHANNEASTYNGSNVRTDFQQRLVEAKAFRYGLAPCLGRGSISKYASLILLEASSRLWLLWFIESGTASLRFPSAHNSPEDPPPFVFDDVRFGSFASNETVSSEPSVGTGRSGERAIKFSGSVLLT